MKQSPSHAAQHIAVAVDAVIFTVIRDELRVLLIQMKKAPYEKQWAFPGGLLEQKEASEDAALRILKTQTGAQDLFLEQLATFDDPERDVLGRVISVAYIALVPADNVHLKTTDRYMDVAWQNIKRLPKLAYDHSRMAQVALGRLRSKLEYTNIAWSLLPTEFTLTELQHIYEVILDRPIDKRNFRKKILSLGLLVSAKKKRKGTSHRPAELFRFKERKSMNVQML